MKLYLQKIFDFKAWLKVFKYIACFFWLHSGLAFIFSKTKSEKEINTYPTLFIWIISIYTALFGFATQRHESQLNRIEEKISSLQALQSDNTTRIKANIYSNLKNVIVLREPEYFSPLTIFNAFFRFFPNNKEKQAFGWRKSRNQTPYPNPRKDKKEDRKGHEIWSNSIFDRLYYYKVAHEHPDLAERLDLLGVEVYESFYNDKLLCDNKIDVNLDDLKNNKDFHPLIFFSNNSRNCNELKYVFVNYDSGMIDLSRLKINNARLGYEGEQVSFYNSLISGSKFYLSNENVVRLGAFKSDLMGTHINITVSNTVYLPQRYSLFEKFGMTTRTGSNEILTNKKLGLPYNQENFIFDTFFLNSLKKYDDKLAIGIDLKENNLSFTSIDINSYDQDDLNGKVRVEMKGNNLFFADLTGLPLTCEQLSQNHNAEWAQHSVPNCSNYPIRTYKTIIADFIKYANDNCIKDIGSYISSPNLRKSTCLTNKKGCVLGEGHKSKEN